MTIAPPTFWLGEFGVRSEVNGYIDTGAALITPIEPQRDLIIL